MKVVWEWLWIDCEGLAMRAWWLVSVGRACCLKSVWVAWIAAEEIRGRWRGPQRDLLWSPGHAVDAVVVVVGATLCGGCNDLHSLSTETSFLYFHFHFQQLFDDSKFNFAMAKDRDINPAQAQRKCPPLHLHLHLLHLYLLSVTSFSLANVHRQITQAKRKSPLHSRRQNKTATSSVQNDSASSTPTACAAR